MAFFITMISPYKLTRLALGDDDGFGAGCWPCDMAPR